MTSIYWQASNSLVISSPNKFVKPKGPHRIWVCQERFRIPLSLSFYSSFQYFRMFWVCALANATTPIIIAVHRCAFLKTTSIESAINCCELWKASFFQATQLASTLVVMSCFSASRPMMLFIPVDQCALPAQISRDRVASSPSSRNTSKILASDSKKNKRKYTSQLT